MSILRKVALAGAALALSLTAIGAKAEAPREASNELMVIPDSYKINGWALGCQAWSWNHFTVMEAIEKTHEVGGKVIEFFPGQRLRKDQAVGFGHTSPDAVIEQVKAQLKKYDILPVAYGVVSPDPKHSDEQRHAEWDQIFAFAKKLNLRNVTSEPRADDMDYIEKLVKQYDIGLAIHDHPKRANDPSYKFWDPNYVLSLVKDRDPRMGSCADTGHWVRSGIKPVDALKILNGRIIESHLKDLNEFGPGAHDVPYGQGVSDVKGILEELKRQNFKGHISIEYEYHQENPTEEITKCVEYFKNLPSGK